MTQKPPFELLLTVSGIQPRVPRRTLSAHPAVQLRRIRHPFRMPTHLSLWQPTAARPALACPECLDPFPLWQPFSASLDGRDAVEYYGSAAPV
jgi:hypothetical protein